MKSTEFLNKKLKRGLPVPFVLNENEECLFLMSNNPARHFILMKYVKILMGLNYFDLGHAKNTQLPLSLLEKGIMKKCALLPAKIEGTSNCCYAAASNDWLTLNKLSNFRVMGEFNHEK